MYRLLVSVAVVCLAACATPAQAPIAVLHLQPEQQALTSASWRDPLVISSFQAAAGYFDAEAMKALGRQIDFERQFLLVFAWQGSGGDMLSYTVAESFPEQVFFSMQRGLTRDLRRHVQVFVLRTDVLWSIQSGPHAVQERRPAEGLQPSPGPGSRLWQEEVDRRAGLRDAHGCGPQIGSIEWMYAVGRALGVYDGQGHGPDPGSEEWQSAVHRKAFGAEP